MLRKDHYSGREEQEQEQNRNRTGTETGTRTRNCTETGTRNRNRNRNQDRVTSWLRVGPGQGQEGPERAKVRPNRAK